MKTIVKHDDGKLFQVEYIVTFWVRGDRRNPIGERRFGSLMEAERDTSMLRKKYRYETAICEKHIPVNQ